MFEAFLSAAHDDALPALERLREVAGRTMWQLPVAVVGVLLCWPRSRFLVAEQQHIEVAVMGPSTILSCGPR
jgi:hypothetical protein